MDTKQIPEFFKGVIVPLLTTFNEDKSLDETALRSLVNWLCTKKVSAFFPMGGSGEYKTLTIDERKKIIKAVFDASKGRAATVAGVGGNSLEETLELSRYSQDCGVEGIGVVVPTFIEPKEEAIFDYYKKIDDAVNIPIMIYDPTGSGITPRLMKKLIGLRNITGIKYRTVNLEKVALMIMETQDKAAIICGVETIFLSSLVIGSPGVIGGGANIYPNLIYKIYEKFNAGDLRSAREAQFKVCEALHTLGWISWPMSGKIALRALGLPIKLVTRVETRPFSEQDVAYIRTYFRKMADVL